MPGNLILVLGDQLDRRSSAFDGFDRDRDRVWMAEVAEESTHVWTHKARITVFLSAMRHFRAGLQEEGITVDYTELSPCPRRESRAHSPPPCLRAWPAVARRGACPTS